MDCNKESNFVFKHEHLPITIRGGIIVPESNWAYVQQPGLHTALLHFPRAGKDFGCRRAEELRGSALICAWQPLC